MLWISQYRHLYRVVGTIQWTGRHGVNMDGIISDLSLLLTVRTYSN
jgi:hypothetical protein